MEFLQNSRNKRILYQEGSFLREAWKEQVIIRIHKKDSLWMRYRILLCYFFLSSDQLVPPFYYLQCLEWQTCSLWCCCLSGHLVVWVIHVPTLNCLFSSSWNSWGSPYWLNFVHLSPPFSTEGNVKNYHVSVAIFEISYTYSISMPMQSMPIYCIWRLIDIY